MFIVAEPVDTLIATFAKDRWAAAPVGVSGWSYRAGESVDGLLARVPALRVHEDGTAWVLARGDRPLLLTSRDIARGMGLVSAPLFGRMAERGGLDGAIPLSSLDEKDRESMRSIAPPVPALAANDVKVRLGLAFGGVYRLSTDREAPIYQLNIKGRFPAFDPDRHRSKFIIPDPDPVPTALRAVLAAAPPPQPGTRTLAEWLAPYPSLVLDSRAAGWRIALGGSGSTAAGLGAIARASGLAFRPLADRWILAASPGDPRAYGRQLAQNRDRLVLFDALAPLARRGRIPEDLFVLLAESPGSTPISQMKAETASRVRNLLTLPGARISRRVPGSGQRGRQDTDGTFRKELVRASAAGRVIFTVGIAGQVDLLAGAATYGIGVQFR